MAFWSRKVFGTFEKRAPAVDLEVGSDAAGSLGFGAYFEGLWFVGSWDKSQVSQSIV